MKFLVGIIRLKMAETFISVGTHTSTGIAVSIFDREDASK
jgi:hypothetical protein